MKEIWSQSKYGKVFLSIFVALTLMVGIGAFVSVEPSHAGASAIPDLAPPTRDVGAAELPASGTFAPLVKRVAPAVVSIQSERTAKQVEMPQGYPFDFFFGPNGPQRDAPEQHQKALGSGVIVSPDGYIMTNNHVIEDADKVEVMLSDERTLKAKVVGADPKTDVAVLKIDATNLPTLELGNSDTVEVGDIVLAIGNPFGIGQTVTMGIVGATSRAFGIMARSGGYEDFIQTDAAINPGNSGGALINTHGQVIGINTAILSQSGGNNGVGFAVPINLAHGIMRQLVDTGHVTRGYMGVQIGDVDAQMAKLLDLPDAHGAVVSSVEGGGPADTAGFKRYDVIRKIDGDPIRDSRELRLKVAGMPPGRKIDVSVLRDGKDMSLPITLGTFPEEEQKTAEAAPEEGAMGGVEVEALSPEMAGRLQLAPTVQGVVVTRVASGTPAAEAGLAPGDVIQEVNKKPVDSVAGYRSAVNKTEGDAVLLLVYRRGSSSLVIVEK